MLTIGLAIFSAGIAVAAPKAGPVTQPGPTGHVVLHKVTVDKKAKPSLWKKAKLKVVGDKRTSCEVQMHPVTSMMAPDRPGRREVTPCKNCVLQLGKQLFKVYELCSTVLPKQDTLQGYKLSSIKVVEGTQANKRFAIRKVEIESLGSPIVRR